MSTAVAQRSEFRAPIDHLEIRAAGNGEDFTLTGHAAVFERWSEDMWTPAGTFREQIARGAFTEVLERNPDVRLLINHDGLPLARTKSGTLELSEDDVGLRIWARLAPTGTATDLRMAMKRGDLDQMSFAFTVAEDEWREDHDTEEVERTITRVADLFDVSVVTYPAYPDTDAAMRELRAAADAGKIVARAETDPVGIANSGDSEEPAPAETDPVEPLGSPLAELKARATAAKAREGESYLRLLKEINR